MTREIPLYTLEGVRDAEVTTAAGQASDGAVPRHRFDRSKIVSAGQIRYA